MLVKRIFVNMCHIKTKNDVTIACYYNNMGVSKNRGETPPKWMVKIMENQTKPYFLMDDLGGF